MPVTGDNIAMVLDIAKYGVEEIGVVFTLVTPPTYGTLVLDPLTSQSDNSFTLQDINQDKVTIIKILISYLALNIKFLFQTRSYKSGGLTRRRSRDVLAFTCRLHV